MAFDEFASTFTMRQVLEIGDDMTLPEDVLVYNKKVDEKLKAKCFYDGVMGAFILRLFKADDDLETGIGLRLEAIRLIMVLFPRLDAIVARYNQRDMYTAYRFEIGKMKYLTIGQNPPKFGGKKYIDVREYYPSNNDSDKLVPTKIGIRIPIQIIQKFKRLIKTCLDETAAMMKTSSDIFNEVKVFMLERDIRCASLLHNECASCPVEHKAALKHKKTGLCSDPCLWEDVVKIHFKDSIKGLRREEVIRLATRTNNRLGGSPFVTEEITELSDDELQRALTGITKPNKGRVYKHMNDIITEEEEELDKKINKETKEELEANIKIEQEAEERAADGDVDSDEEKRQPKRKKAKHLWEQKFKTLRQDQLPSTSVLSDEENEQEQPKTKRLKIEESSPLEDDDTIKIESTSDESE